MTIDSLPAIPAASSANVAQTTAVQATDGAQIHTDEQAGLTAFAAIFQQLSQAVATEAPAAQATVPDAPTLPTAPIDAAPPAQPQRPSPTSPLLLNLQLLDDGAAEPEVEDEELPLGEKPQKLAESKCDSTQLPVPLPTQPLDIQLPSDSQEPPAIQENAPKTKPIQPRKTIPNDEPAPRETKKSEPKIESIQIPQEIADDSPPPSKETAPSVDHPKLEAPKSEFTLPQPHLAQNEIDAPASPPLPAEQSFIQSNHPKIITAIHGELLPNGGSMHIRLDPPELGALAVQIDVRDGIVNASFQTSNDEATRLLSHSLTQLRTTLESAGVTVEKLQVQQAPREHFNSSNNDRDRNPRQQAYEHSSHDDRQRREMLQRMWRRLTVGRDMLDLVA